MGLKTKFSCSRLNFGTLGCGVWLIPKTHSSRRYVNVPKIIALGCSKIQSFSPTLTGCNS